MVALAMGGMRTATALAAAAALVLLVSACAEREEPIAAAPSLYPVRVQGAGDQPTVLDRRPARILPLAPGAQRLLEELGAKPQLVGPRLRSAAFWKLDGPKLVREIVEFKPDLIVATRASDPLDLMRAARKARAPVYLLPDVTLRDVQRAIVQLGFLGGHPVEARLLVARNAASIARVTRKVARTPVVRVFVDTGFFTTIGTRTVVGDAMRLARGRNVAGNAEPGPFDQRKLARLDPQVYIATTNSGTTLRYLRRNKKTRGISAVRSGRFALVSPRLLQVDGKLGNLLVTMARLLHPAAFR